MALRETFRIIGLLLAWLLLFGQICYLMLVGLDLLSPPEPPVVILVIGLGVLLTIIYIILNTKD